MHDRAVTPSIVCGVDHSPGARVAAQFTGRLAQRLSLRIVLVHAVHPAPIAQRDVGMPDTWDDFAVFEQLRAAGADLLETIQQELDSDFEIDSVITIGDASDVLADVAREAAAEFVVVGSRGLGGVGKFFLGSVSTRVAAHGPCPAVVVPESGGALDGRPILCAVDDSEHSRHAIATAATLAERLETELVLVHAEADGESSSADAEELMARLVVESGLGTSVERMVVRGEPADAIVEAANARGAEMIVIGSRGRGALAASVLGSVSSSVAEHAGRPVTIVGDRAATAAERSPETR